MKWIKASCLAVISLALLFGASFAIAADTVKIGLLAALTGDAAADGESVANSVARSRARQLDRRPSR